MGGSEQQDAEGSLVASDEGLLYSVCCLKSPAPPTPAPQVCAFEWWQSSGSWSVAV